MNFVLERVKVCLKNDEFAGHGKAPPDGRVSVRTEEIYQSPACIYIHLNDICSCFFNPQGRRGGKNVDFQLKCPDFLLNCPDSVLKMFGFVLKLPDSACRNSS